MNKNLAIKIPNAAVDVQQAFKDIEQGFNSLAKSQKDSLSLASLQGISSKLAAMQTQLNSLSQIVNSLLAGGNIAEYTALTNIAAYTLVYLVSTVGILPVDTNNSSTADRIVGITLSSAASGGQIKVAQIESIVTNSSWGWVLGDVYADGVGGFTQTPPTSGFICLVGFAVSATSIFVNIGTPTFLPTGTIEGDLTRVVSQTLSGQLVLTDVSNTSPVLNLSSVPVGVTIATPDYSIVFWYEPLGLTIDGDLILGGDLVELVP